MVDIICIADIQLTILYSIIITVLFYEILYQAKWEAQWKILSATERANIVSNPIHDRPNYRIYGFGFKREKKKGVMFKLYLLYSIIFFIKEYIVE